MSVKRFVATSAREAMSQVRLALGNDAVILSNRAVSGGVELCAVAAENMNDLIGTGQQVAARTKASTTGARPVPAIEPAYAHESLKEKMAAPPADDPVEHGFQDYLKSVAGKRKAAQKEPEPSTASFVRERNDRSRAKPPVAPASAPVSIPAAASPFPPAASRPSASPAPRVASKTGDESLLSEIQSMKGLLQEQLTAFAWFDAARKHPLHAKLIGTLLGAGFSPALSRYIVERLPADFSDTQAKTWLNGALAHNLPCQSAEDNLLDRGGVFALVGPTGVGKTTTTAKLAARYALRYGAQRVGMITTDSYRIGAHDQLRIYGKILGIPVHLAQGDNLRGLVESMRDKRVILIDTAGVGQRDERVPEHIAQLDDAAASKILLLNAAAQGETLEEVIRVYLRFGLAGAIVTKIDEAAKLGQALDCVIRHKLVLPFITNGQLVPEDLHPAHAAFLVHRAIEAATPPAFALEGEEHGILFARARLPHNSSGRPNAGG